jgi:hypothetical protein
MRIKIFTCLKGATYDEQSRSDRTEETSAQATKATAIGSGPLAGLQSLQLNYSPDPCGWGLDRFGITDKRVKDTTSIAGNVRDQTAPSSTVSRAADPAVAIERMHSAVEARGLLPAQTATSPLGVYEQVMPNNFGIVGSLRPTEPVCNPAMHRSRRADDPGFKLPRGQRRFGQPFRRTKPGVTAAEANASFRAFAPAAWAGNVSLVRTDPLTPPTASTDFAMAAYSFGGLHELVGAVFNFHALTASLKKRDRYGRQLDAMLEADVARFRGGREGRGGFTPERRGSIERLPDDGGEKVPSIDSRSLETLILQRENMALAPDANGAYVLRGKFVYDMDKVERLAAMDEAGKPEHMKQAILNARNVFLTAHIKDEVATKRAKRALYDGVRNIFGMAGATALAAGTHGAAAPAALAAKQAGYGLLAAGALDPANMTRGYKQRFRDEKAKQIEDGTLARLAPYFEHFGLHPAIIKSAKQETADSERCRQLIKTYQAAQNRASEQDVEATQLVDQTAAGTRAVIEAAATRHAGKMKFGRVGLKGGLFNQEKNTRAKADRIDLAAKHVARIADYHLDEFCNDEKLLKRFVLDFAEPADTISFRTKIGRQREEIKRDEYLRAVYGLFRDVGFGRTEATIAITNALNRRWSNLKVVPSSLLPKAIREDLSAASGRFTRDDIIGIGGKIKDQR